MNRSCRYWAHIFLRHQCMFRGKFRAIIETAIVEAIKELGDFDD